MHPEEAPHLAPLSPAALADFDEPKRSTLVMFGVLTIAVRIYHDRWGYGVYSGPIGSAILIITAKWVRAVRAPTRGPPPLAETPPSWGPNPLPTSWLGRLDTGPQLTHRKWPSAAPSLQTQFVLCLDSPPLHLAQVT